jgi:Uma2 family endonuclease
MSTTVQSMTAADLLRLPADGHRYELIRGELRQMAPAGPTHGRLAMRLAAHLFQHVETHHLGTVYAAETGFQLTQNPDTVRAPDVAFVSRQRLEAVGETEGYWPGAPDVAVEVISPSDRYTDVEDKVVEWLEAGSRMVIVVNPRQRSVTVYHSRTDVVRLTEEDMLEGGDVVPGWQLPIREVFI